MCFRPIRLQDFLIINIKGKIACKISTTRWVWPGLHYHAQAWLDLIWVDLVGLDMVWPH